MKTKLAKAGIEISNGKIKAFDVDLAVKVLSNSEEDDEDYEEEEAPTQKNPYLKEIEQLLSHITLVIKKDINSLNKRGDVIDIKGPDGELEDLGGYMRGRSSNKAVGSDVWSAEWIIEQLRKGNVAIDAGEEEDTETKAELLAAETNYHDFDEGDD